MSQVPDTELTAEKMMSKRLTSYDQFETVRKYLIERNDFRLTRIPLSGSDEWGCFDGEIRREDRNFFTVTGLRAHNPREKATVTESPIIH